MKKLIYALLSVVIAFGLWLYVITTVSPEWEETFYNIPVVLKNESVLPERGLMIATDELPNVTLRLRGNRSDLIKLTSENITITADMAGVYSSGEQNISYVITYPGDVPGNAIEVISKSPIRLTFKKRITKNMLVEVDFGGTTVPSGYITDKENQTLSSQYVSITGPKDVVDRIAHAKINVNLTDQTESIIDKAYPIELFDKNGEAVTDALLSMDVTEVNFTLKIQRYKQIQLLLNIIPGGGATADNTLITMDMETIQVSGSDQLLSTLGDTLELGEIPLGDILEDTVLEFTIKLPVGVDNLTGKDTVSVSVSFPDLSKKTLTATNISAVNVPEGMAAEILAKQLVVTVRGPAEQVELLTPEDISVIVDFAKAELGQDSYRAQIVIGEVAPDVGAVENYTVFASVTEAQEVEPEDQKGQTDGTDGSGN